MTRREDQFQVWRSYGGVKDFIKGFDTRHEAQLFADYSNDGDKSYPFFYKVHEVSK
jgi:hypothetical protein